MSSPPRTSGNGKSAAITSCSRTSASAAAVGARGTHRGRKGHELGHRPERARLGGIDAAAAQVVVDQPALKARKEHEIDEE